MRRRAARVIVLDERGRTLLLSGRDPARPQDLPFWFTPGGGVEGNETLQEAARRELLEETGLLVEELGPVVHQRSASFVFDGEPYEQDEDYFVVRTTSRAGWEPDRSGWTELEQRCMVEVRWWTVEELRETSETVYPDELVALITRWS